jgi:hypothetical protein
MSIQASKATLLDAIDDLLSVRSSPARQTAALASLEAVVARLAVDPAAPPLADAFLRWQDSPSRNGALWMLPEDQIGAHSCLEQSLQPCSNGSDAWLSGTTSRQNHSVSPTVTRSFVRRRSFECWLITVRENIGSDVLRCLRLLQGVLLLHRPSQHFFARKATHEVRVLSF